MPKTCPVCATSYTDTSVFCPADGTTLRADEDAGDLVGSVIADRYLIKKLLGEGGMGRVYLAQHVRLPQMAAIKVLHPGMVKDQDAVARFYREADNAAKIEHERVARVFDFGETRDGLVYLAMEFVPGNTLRAILADEPRLPPSRAANLVYQIAEGLDAAHRISIVHRDLKPDNILVITDEQGVDRSKVVDFGIAKAVDGAQTQLTRTGMVVGTPEFMSPEQVLGEPLDARSDVYALGLLAYQMLTGVLPFSATTPERSLTARLIEDPRPLSVAAPDISWPADLQAAFDHVLAREPNDRTPSAMAFADALVGATEAWTGASVIRGRTPLSTSAITIAANAVRPSTPTPAIGANATIASAAPSSTSTAVAPVARKRTPLLMGIVSAVAVAAGAIFMIQRGAGGTVTSMPPDSTQRIVAPQNTTTSTGATVPSASDGVAPMKRVIASQGASPTGSGGAPSSGTATATMPAAVSSGVINLDAVEAKRKLDEIRTQLIDPNADEASAAKRVPELLGLMKRLTSAADSTLAWIALANAYAISGQPDEACGPIKNAARSANAGQQTIVRSMKALLPNCGP